MTVSSPACESSHVWSGVETVFSTGIEIRETSQLVVSLTDAVGEAIPLTIGVHVAAEIVDGIATLSPLAIPAQTGTVRVLRQTALKQDQAFPSDDNYAPEAHELAHDLAAMRLAELRRDTNALLSLLDLALGVSVEANRAEAAAQDARDAAGAAATSAEHAALFDPAVFYPRTAFKADGTAGAPVKYGADGELTAILKARVTGAAGTVRSLRLATAGLDRWSFGVDGVEEAGADTGSGFFLRFADDAGVDKGAIFTVSRATGVLSFATVPTVSGAIAVADYSANIPTTQWMRDNVIQSYSVQGVAGLQSVSFSKIPSWARRIVVDIDELYTNGSYTPRIQLGSAAGMVTTSTYKGAMTGTAGGGVATVSHTSGFQLAWGTSAGAGQAVTSKIILTKLGNTNKWQASIATGFTAANNASNGAGIVDVGAPLDRLRLVTTDTFTAGNITITVE